MAHITASRCLSNSSPAANFLPPKISFCTPTFIAPILRRLIYVRPVYRRFTIHIYIIKNNTRRGISCKFRANLTKRKKKTKKIVQIISRIVPRNERGKRIAMFQWKLISRKNKRTLYAESKLAPFQGVNERAWSFRRFKSVLSLRINATWFQDESGGFEEGRENGRESEGSSASRSFYST